MVNQIVRLAALQKQTALTGIDFVRVEDPTTQTELKVFFLTDARNIDTPFVDPNALQPANIVIHNASDPNQPNVVVKTVGPVDFDAELQRAFIDVTVAEPGGFADYRLRIDDPLPLTDPTKVSRIDPFFNDVRFSFKAGCGDGQECLDPTPVCPVDVQPDFPVDYLARDFVSLRNALLDFAAQRFPEWVSPIEADVGGMLAEVMAALGDELSYIQDRYGREGYLETATQRRSLRKKARLLDFEIHDGRSPSTLLELTVTEPPPPAPPAPPPPPEVVPHGARVWSTTEGGDPIAFEVGLGMGDTSPDFVVHQSWNAGDVLPAGALNPYVLDDSQLCLQVGATEILVQGAVQDLDNLFDPQSGTGRILLLRTDPADPAQPARRQFVRIAAIPDVQVDPLTKQTFTHIVWDPRDALPFQLDQTQLQLSLNIVPVTAGLTQCARFTCGDISDSTVPRPPVTPFDCKQDPSLPKPVPGLAVEREGPLPIAITPALAADVTPDASTPGRDERPTIFLIGLPDTDTDGLGFLGPDLRDTTAQIQVQELFIDATGVETPGDQWFWQRSLIGSEPTDSVFTLEDGIWRRIIGFTQAGVEIVHQDYATGAGYSIRFGDGVFGRIPPRGQVFQATYRLGPGARGNVPQGAVSAFEVPGHTSNMPTFVLAARNPVEVTDGVDPEGADEIKQLVPAAFSADPLFAVTPDDYGTQAQKLPFVQRGHGTSRWTGSWLSMFVAADPFGSFLLTADEKSQLEAWMDCVRQTGRDVVVRDPNTLVIDLKITICVEPFAYASQVMAQVRDLLVGSGGGRNTTPFFSPDNFTFGMPLRRSALEAVIHRVAGVRFVRSVEIRERGVLAFHELTDLLRTVDDDQVLRIQDDPAHPESGTLTLIPQGGA
jgi:hypothetical protein